MRIIQSLAVIALLSTSAEAIRLFEEPKTADVAAEATKVSADKEVPRAADGEWARAVTKADKPGNLESEAAISDQVGGTIKSKEGSGVSINNPNIGAPTAPAGTAKAEE